jgi:DNA-directed RNA polymerase specialized sigma24 family protein
MAENDEDLWRKCVAGDADAFEALFARHADAVFRYCLSRCGSWHDAEELVSITFLEAWRQRTRLRPERDSVLPWLLGVATNADRNRGRASRGTLTSLPGCRTQIRGMVKMKRTMQKQLLPDWMRSARSASYWRQPPG